MTTGEPQPQRVPLNDLERGAGALHAELVNAAARVLESGWYLKGRECESLERELASYLSVQQVVGVASGTDALELAMQAVMPQGRRGVLTAANCGGYASVAAIRCGYQPRFADVDESTLCLSAATVEQKLTADVGAVVVTHLFGRFAPETEKLYELCHSRGIALIEDCAQAIGAVCGERRAGSIGDAATFSFYPTKNLGALGDGGAVATNSATTADTVRQLAQYGWSRKYEIDLTGGQNSRLDEIQAALLRVKLQYIDEWNRTRRSILQKYAQAASPRVRIPMKTDKSHVAHLAVAISDDRPALQEHMRACGIQTDIHYPVPDHKQRAWREWNHEVSLPVTEQLAESILTLPCFPELTSDEVERVCSALAEF